VSGAGGSSQTPPNHTGHLPAAGHRLAPHTADWMIEAWGSDRASCLTEALYALVEEFAEVSDAAASRLLPLATESPGAEDALVSLLEDVIYALDVFSVVPVRFHLTETESGGIAGDITAWRCFPTRGGGGVAC